MRKLRLGMIGGGSGAFIGEIHRIAAQLDNEIELISGAFSSDPVNSKAFGKTLYLAPNRCYGTYQEMLIEESQKSDDEKLDMIAIVTPNHLHFPIAKMAIELGFNVISDKPATLNLTEALTLKTLVEKHQVHYALTHTYTGYPMVMEAKQRVALGQLGSIVKVVVQYPQGWLANESNEDNKQAKWRLDPALSGMSCAMADIGVHAANLAEFISGLEISELCADLNTTVDGRRLDDDGAVLLRFNSGARGVLIASQVCVGEENNLSISVYGTKASIHWQQHTPNDLQLKHSEKTTQHIRFGIDNCCPIALKHMRTPAGHPEGYLEAFANIYAQFAALIRTSIPQPNLPGINAAVRGMAFIENTVNASHSQMKWHPFTLVPQCHKGIDNE